MNVVVLLKPSSEKANLFIPVSWSTQEMVQRRADTTSTGYVSSVLIAKLNKFKFKMDLVKLQQTSLKWLSAFVSGAIRKNVKRDFFMAFQS